ncbi:HD domain-containing protein [Candidatus Methylomicrobium oryzae]|uniref:HD domain-containing protein n=1 Tax=Candidatus Methylomicrobium oryzae TaxID=2802053 RepID=UPI0019228E31|nr:HD domain-containing protein [Methylomicrobium sp. RS1]MBL1263906.1 hypothetical protein [Methylomicrobium sp. RS1]
MNTARPPFRIDSSQSIDEAAVEIVQLFRSIGHLPNKVGLVFQTLAACLALAPNNAYMQAGLRLAEAIDGDDPCFDLPYHNRQHVCEVMLCCRYLALALDLAPQATLEIILAALFHDYRHDGNSCNPIPFRLERHSINQAQPYLLAAGLNPTQCRKLTALVLATQPTAGLPVALAYYHHHCRQGPRPEAPAYAPELTELDNIDNATHALILCLADVLPSLGLTIEHALHLQEKLAQEWGKPLGIEDKVRFIEHTQHLFILCDRFIPNVMRLKNHLLSIRHGGSAD